MSLEAIIFDVDGTLAETEEIHRATFNRAFNEAGLDWRWDQALYGQLLKVAGGKERLRYFVESEKRLRVARDVDALIAALHRRKTSLYAEMVAKGQVALRPGVAELIEGARADGVRLAIATTTSRSNVDALLQATLGDDGLAAFEVIVTGESAPAKKPAPDVFLHALQRLRLSPRQCLAIEDSENGLLAASRAGLVTLIVTSQYSRDEDFTGAARVVSDLGELARPTGERDGRGPPTSGEMIAAARALHGQALAPRAGDGIGEIRAGAG